MTAHAIAQKVGQLLTSEATFTAALMTLLGVAVAPPMLMANQPFGSLDSAQMPCWVMEPGDGEAAALTDNSDATHVIGIEQMGMAMDIEFALVWHQHVRETAATQRWQLADLIARLFLRHPTLDDTATFALLTEFTPDRGGNHPLQIFRARVRVTYLLGAA